ncbi:tyrosine-protein phosphatase [Pseudalkalibacillus hwajinpoensis]|uniref:Tyrosine-protein phosphatase n=1 Tax=Guptibacillus hwajinpoensis TaxID=208199 RepID=A0A4U1MI83_9BACL|nr:CpsB/CapC family capsule biosynthesis tyrosine phosphatase [Pseudalkalibacillus hwajinpoensis]TKD70723.1 tyrosine protein phosphatase [Pseudalkalibacillus hwajinpoensis]
MIDIHSHILPGIDDGASTIEESIEMAKQAVSEGITKVVATPHHRNGSFDNEKKVILQEVAILNKEFEREKIDLKVIPGQEIRIYGDMIDDYGRGKLLSINETGTYLLIEFPQSHVPAYANKLLFDLQISGLIPIIVHPERNQEFIENPKRLYQIVKEGSLCQLTASAVTGQMGKKVKQFSHEIITHNLAHFIASDSHNVKTRPCDLRKALDTVENKFGLSMRYMMQENAEFLIEGKVVQKEPPQRIHKKKRLGIF